MSQCTRPVDFTLAWSPATRPLKAVKFLAAQGMYYTRNFAGRLSSSSENQKPLMAFVVGEFVKAVKDNSKRSVFPVLGVVEGHAFQTGTGARGNGGRRSPPSPKLRRG